MLGYMGTEMREIVTFGWIRMYIVNVYDIWIHNDIKYLIFIFTNACSFKFENVFKIDGLNIKNNNKILYHTTNDSVICALNKISDKQDISVKFRINKITKQDPETRIRCSIGVMETEAFNKLKQNGASKFNVNDCGIMILETGKVFNGYEDRNQHIIMDSILKHNNISVGKYIYCWDKWMSNYNLVKVMNKNEYGIQIHWVLYDTKWDMFINKSDYDMLKLNNESDSNMPIPQSLTPSRSNFLILFIRNLTEISCLSDVLFNIHKTGSFVV